MPGVCTYPEAGCKSTHAPFDNNQVTGKRREKTATWWVYGWHVRYVTPIKPNIMAALRQMIE
jgi:hypothetical protein